MRGWLWMIVGGVMAGSALAQPVAPGSASAPAGLERPSLSVPARTQDRSPPAPDPVGSISQKLSALGRGGALPSGALAKLTMAEAEASQARIQARISHRAEVEAGLLLALALTAEDRQQGGAAADTLLSHYASHPLGNPLLIEIAALRDELHQQIGWISLPAGALPVRSQRDARGRGGHVRDVRIDAFELSTTEVTVAQYGACVRSGQCTAPETGDSCNWGRADRGSHPVNCVTWDQAQGFARWAGARLPTALEWQYAARSAIRGHRYPWGATAPDCERAVLDDGRPGCPSGGCGEGGTAPVCSRPAGHSVQGACDLAGNVGEWVADDSAAPNRFAWGGSFGLPAAQIGAKVQQRGGAAHPEVGIRLARAGRRR